MICSRVWARTSERMRMRALKAACILLATMAMVGLPERTLAQVDCESIPAGPSRTDCYTGLARINRGQSSIASEAGKQSGAAATLQKQTGAFTPKARRPSKSRAR